MRGEGWRGRRRREERAREGGEAWFTYSAVGLVDVPGEVLNWTLQ